MFGFFPQYLYSASAGLLFVLGLVYWIFGTLKNFVREYWLLPNNLLPLHVVSINFYLYSTSRITVLQYYGPLLLLVENYVYVYVNYIFLLQ